MSNEWNEGIFNHVLIKCYLAIKGVHETENVLCKQKLNQCSVLALTQTTAPKVEIVCRNSCALHRYEYGMNPCGKMYLFAFLFH